MNRYASKTWEANTMNSAISVAELAMTDRELLKLAAKAVAPMANIEGYLSVPDEMTCSGWRIWDPLTHDGDALRLAVNLRLVIQHAPKYVVVMDHNREVAEHQDTRENDGDPYAATRRAIVRAAAALAPT